MNITRGRTHPPARRVIYGPPGVGKSTFACKSEPHVEPNPRVLAVDYESGLDEIGVARVEGPATWDESLALLRQVCAGPGDWDTVVIDTVDRLEDQATKLVCQIGKKGKPLADLGEFGYGDGFEALATRWREMLFILESARAHGRSVHLVAHVQSKTHDDPMIGSYSRFIAQLQKRCWGATHRWADAVLFAAYEQGRVNDLVVMTGVRVLHTVSGSGFEAKHRPNITPVLPLSWKAYEEDVLRYSRTSEDVRVSIRTLAKNGHAEKAEGFIRDAGDSLARLISIENALRKKVTEVST